MKLRIINIVLMTAILTAGMMFNEVFASGEGNDLLIGGMGQDFSSTDSEKEVPAWIKTSMQFWVEGQTSDAKFLNAVEFLANEKIIHVDAEVQSGTVLEEIEVEKEVDRTTVPVGGQSGGNTSGTWDTEILSMDLSSHDSFFDVFYETYTVDSFFDVFTELQESSNSFFDVFFEVDTPRASECLRGQELVFDERSSSWKCSSANTVDSFFDVFFDVATESSQNTKDIAEIERKIDSLEKKFEELEAGIIQESIQLPGAK